MVQSDNIFTTSIKYICKIQKIIVILHRKPKVCRHNLKAFTIGPHYFMQWGILSACFGVSKSGKFQLNPRQESSKRPWDMYIPPAERPLVDDSVWWHFIFGVGVIVYSRLVGLPEPRYRE